LSINREIFAFTYWVGLTAFATCSNLFRISKLLKLWIQK